MLDHLPNRLKRLVMRFYRDVVRKHIYAHSRHRSHAPVFVSKNPAFSGAILSLREQFPRARIVSIERDRNETVRSVFAWFGVWFRIFGSRCSGSPKRAIVEALVDLWHRYPIDHETIRVNYHHLVARPRDEMNRLARELAVPRLTESYSLDAAVRELRRDHGSRGGFEPVRAG